MLLWIGVAAGLVLVLIGGGVLLIVLIIRDVRNLEQRRR